MPQYPAHSVTADKPWCKGRGRHETWGTVALGRVQGQRSSEGRETFHRGAGQTLYLMDS
jgi:hypothetical protein